MKKIIGIFMSLIMVLSLVQIFRVRVSAIPDDLNQKSEIEQKETEENSDKKTTNNEATQELNKDETKDMVETILSNKHLKTLSEALKATGFDEILKGKGPFTLFAPTDDAFGKLEQSKLEELLKPENKAKLSNILAAHLSSMKFPGSSLVNLNGKEIPMANNKKAKISSSGTQVTINGSRVILKDIVTKNGIIHLIDTVIMP